MNRVEELGSTPPTSMFILNMDAVIFNNLDASVVVERDNSCEVFKVWAKLHKKCSPLHNKATTFLWALQVCYYKELDAGSGGAIIYLLGGGIYKTFLCMKSKIVMYNTS